MAPKRNKVAARDKIMGKILRYIMWNVLQQYWYVPTTPLEWERKMGMKAMFEDLNQKLRNSWKLRMHHRWEWLKLEISEFWWKLKSKFHSQNQDF
jgi:hypothetical protein